MNARYSSRGPAAPSLTTASYGRRVAAFVVDYLLAAALPLPFVVPWYLSVLDASRRIAAGDIGVVAPTPPATVGLGLFLAFVLGIVQWWLGGTRGFTIGKRLLGIRVLDELTGQPIGMGRYLLRQIVLGATGAVVVGYLSPLFDPSGRLRGWHDRAASSAVTEAPSDGTARRAERVARGSADPTSGAAATTGVPFPVPPAGGPKAPVPDPVPSGPAPAALLAQVTAHAPVPPPPGARSVPSLPAYLGEPQPATASHAAVPAAAGLPEPQAPGVPQPSPAAQSRPVPPPPAVSASSAAPVPPSPVAPSPVPPSPVAPSPVPPPPGPVAYAEPASAAYAQPAQAQPAHAQADASAYAQPATPPVQSLPVPSPQAEQASRPHPDAAYGSVHVASGASASTAPTAVVPGAEQADMITAVPRFGHAAPRPAPGAPAPAGQAPAAPQTVVSVSDAAAQHPYDELDDETEMTRLRTDPPRERAAAAHIPPSALMRISDGTELTITDTVLIGRNPAPAADESIGQLVRVQDPGRSVSKTHVLVGVDADGVWVVDRASTNGTVVTLTDGQQIICAEHQVVRLPEGASVTFGDYSASFVHRND